MEKLVSWWCWMLFAVNLLIIPASPWAPSILNTKALWLELGTLALCSLVLLILYVRKKRIPVICVVIVHFVLALLIDVIYSGCVPTLLLTLSLPAVSIFAYESRTLICFCSILVFVQVK